MRYWALVIVLLAVPAQAATLYVNNSGSPACSDATVKASNTSSAPWCTIGRAAWGSTNRAAPNGSEAAAAGDTVLITAGTYSYGWTASSYIDIAFNPTNNGSAGNPIVFRGVGTVILENPDNGPLIGTSSKSYVEWDNFTIYEANARGRANVTLTEWSHGVITVADSDNVTISRMRLFGDTTIPAGDVHYLIFLSGNNTTHTASVIKNNYFQDCIRQSGLISDPNGGAIMTYGTHGTIIEHNEINTCAGGIYSKNAHTFTGANHTIRYNYIYNSARGISLQEVDSAKVHNNIVRDGRASTAQMGMELHLETVTNAIIANNTFEGMDVGIALNANTDWTNNLVQNNIIASTNKALEFQDVTTWWPDKVSFNRNDYYSVTSWFYNGSYTTLAAWQGITAAPDPNSITTDPEFVNASSHNFHLANNSQPALTLGRVVGSICGTNGDTIPVGAYCTGSEEIGIETVVGGSVNHRFSPSFLRRASYEVEP